MLLYKIRNNNLIMVTLKYSSLNKKNIEGMDFNISKFYKLYTNLTTKLEIFIYLPRYT